VRARVRDTDVNHGMTDHCAVSPKAERHDQFAVHAVFISAALPKAAEPLRIMQMCPDTLNLGYVSGP
jgi:hypothetical protein